MKKGENDMYNMILSQPVGGDIVNPTVDNIRELLKRGDDFWRYGDAVLKTNAKHILFTRDKKYGWKSNKIMT